MSESGKLELFLIAGADPRQVHNELSKITGMPLLPAAFSLGYHYSKWDNEISASKVISWNNDFIKYNMPVDSFWLDIGHTDSFKYFEFDPVRFPDKDLEKMK